MYFLGGFCECFGFGFFILNYIEYVIKDIDQHKLAVQTYTKSDIYISGRKARSYLNTLAEPWDHQIMP